MSCRDTSPPSVPRSPRLTSSYYAARVSVGIAYGSSELLPILQSELPFPTSLRLGIPSNAPGTGVVAAGRVVENPKFRPQGTQARQDLPQAVVVVASGRAGDRCLRVLTGRLVERYGHPSGGEGPDDTRGRRSWLILGTGPFLDCRASGMVFRF